MTPTHLYRYTATAQSYVSRSFARRQEEWHIHFFLQIFPILKYTPAGYRIFDTRDRFVLASGHKRYAYPTPELAWESLIRRTRLRLSHAKREFDRTNKILNAMAEVGELPEDRIYIQPS